MILTYTTSVGLPKICLAFDWPTQMKIPRTAPAHFMEILISSAKEIVSVPQFVSSLALSRRARKKL